MILQRNKILSHKRNMKETWRQVCCAGILWWFELSQTPEECSSWYSEHVPRLSGISPELVRKHLLRSSDSESAFDKKAG